MNKTKKDGINTKKWANREKKTRTPWQKHIQTSYYTMTSGMNVRERQRQRQRERECMYIVNTLIQRMQPKISEHIAC